MDFPKNPKKTVQKCRSGITPATINQSVNYNALLFFRAHKVQIVQNRAKMVQRNSLTDSV
jgi:hypothetical protein